MNSESTHSSDEPEQPGQIEPNQREQPADIQFLGNVSSQPEIYDAYQPVAVESANPVDNLPWQRVIPLWVSSAFMPLIAMGFGLIFSIATLFVALGTGLISDPKNILQELSSNLFLTTLFVLAGQLAFAGCALVGAIFSRERIVDRLNLTAGHAHVGLWFVFLLATPLVGMLISILMSMLPIEPSPHLLEMEKMMRTDSTASFLTMFILIAVIPGFCEELLFRGYVQSRLTKVWWSAIGIVYASVFFAMAHMDPMHIILVFPLGIWLGLVAWRCGSIWPAILCHAGNNGLALVQVQLQAEDLPAGGSQLTTFDFGMLGVSALFMLIALISIMKHIIRSGDQIVSQESQVD
jgi:membrane protease YdiL (CAAX protease family)